MRADDFTLLLADVESEILRGRHRLAILGLTPVTIKLIRSLASAGLTQCIVGVFDDAVAGLQDLSLDVPTFCFSEIANHTFDAVAVASDEDKEFLLSAALPFIRGTPKVLIAGYAHHEFHDAFFEQAQRQLLVPSLANGYPETLIHLWQCLKNASRLGLDGCVAEFGMFKGGTTMLLSKFVEHFGRDWPVIGFDTFCGFPPRRSPLDMYDHPGCHFEDLPAVRDPLSGRNVEIVPGDIVETCHRLDHERVVLAFVDTDNYTPATAAISVLQDRVLVGGAIVFDHFTGRDRFRYTLGEKIAASILLDDPRYFNLHRTGVFLRQS